MDIQLIELLVPSDNPTEPDVCTGSVCTISWHPVKPIGAVAKDGGFAVVNAA